MDIKPSTKILIKMFIYSIVMSFFILLFTSKYSFIFDKVNFIRNDSLIYNTLGIVPFISEIILLGVYLFYMYRIGRLFLNKFSSSLLIPLNAIGITTSNIFIGGSVSEYTLVLISICLYYYLRHFNKKMLTSRDMLLCGVLSGITFCLDYYLFGIWIGFILFIVLDYLINRNQKRVGIKRLSSFIGGFIIPLAIIGLIEWYFKDIKVFLDSYFVNRFKFSFSISMLKDYFSIIWSSGILTYWIVLLSPILLFRLDTNIFSKIGLIVMFLLMVLFIFVNNIDNNLLIVLSYFNIGLVSLFSFVDDRCKDFMKYYYKGIMIFVSVICILFSIYASNIL